jgi:hypothetical protein
LLAGAHRALRSSLRVPRFFGMHRTPAGVPVPRPLVPCHPRSRYLARRAKPRLKAAGSGPSPPLPYEALGIRGEFPASHTVLPAWVKSRVRRIATIASARNVALQQIPTLRR